MDRFDCIFIR